MNVQTLKDLYMAELQEARSVEAQLSEALPKMIAAASAGELKQALEDHLGETRSQLERMEERLARDCLRTRRSNGWSGTSCNGTHPPASISGMIGPRSTS